MTQNKTSNGKLQFIGVIALILVLVFAYWVFMMGLFSTDDVPEREARDITWDELIPEGVAYGEIIGDGEIDVVNDIWKPAYDANSFKMNDALVGQTVRIPAFMAPLEMEGENVKSFLAVPYAGACVHTPPPPANQIIEITLDQSIYHHNINIPVFVVGVLQTNLVETDLAVTGYQLTNVTIEPFEYQIPEME